ncbi:protein translocase subunit SecD [Photobacterium damselae]|uniref:Protein translocase subunit SecD n=5 Tax=Photobacterium damselae TaxID=38293 RepID=A0A7L8A953_PHODP|nr:protein translocase subunit SecD [Photobacterium damselae]ELI6449703.1 protein translocase subunit SecD [Photobacterium damselae]ELV7517627.1 protein translocase subunit SecD [Photobacterium damselae]MBA5685124.1 protein translocase subunit SecD [Photobacterium damselae subsp. damselae]MBE8126835.1 protein translocase subunit SecD [Photobacterium damselae subsp. piscicida]MCG3816068.1 protein translocase subunit SecD [Photobacterium damselae]
MVMRKRKPQQILNHYSAWKYVVLVVTVAIMLLSAIPTWFGEDAAVQISAKGGPVPTPFAIKKELDDNHIAIKKIEQKPAHTIVILDEEDQQTKAKEVLAKLIKGENAEERLTLALEPAAPMWLQDMGFEPIKLGLDLRGGVQFLLDVDVNQVFKVQGQSLADDLRADFRKEGIRAARVEIMAADKLLVRLPSSDANSKIRHFVEQQYPQWQPTNGNGDNLILTLKEKEQTELRNLTVQQNLQTMRSRIEELGITEAVVQRQGENRIRIELPGVQDPAAAKKVIGATASLAFYAVKQEGTGSTMVLDDKQGRPVRVGRKPVLSGDHIIDARAGFGEMSTPEVNITLDSAGGHIMSEFSRHNIGKPMATSYSEYSRNDKGETVQTNTIISVATIQSQLGSRFRITGAGSLEDAQQLALLLRAGSLTAPVTIVEERTIGPTLGAENIKNGFAALALGMGVTLLFMAVWYRRLGWVANIALICNMIMLFGLLALIPGAVLTLPGIAGLVLTVGMAVDTNVLIFERIKDKLKEGRSFAQAIDRGFSSAFSTIFDANFTTMITAVVLYAIGNGPIQGFALTLGLGLLTSMFTGIFASRAIINLVWGRDSRHDVRV